MSSMGGNYGIDRLDTGDELLAFAGEDAEVAFHLDAVPEGVGLAEKNAEANGHGRSDGPLAEHDLVDRPRRHADGASHGVLRNTHGLEIFLQQDLAWGNTCLHGYNVWRHGRGSMLIHDATPAGPASVQRKTMRHWPLIRMEWEPVRLPLKSSSRLPDETARSVSRPE